MTFGVERDLARRGIDTARTRGATYADVGGALTGLIEKGEIAGATQY